MKQNQIHLQGKIGKYKTTMKDFNTFLSEIHKTEDQKHFTTLKQNY